MGGKLYRKNWSGWRSGIGKGRKKVRGVEENFTEKCWLTVRGRRYEVRVGMTSLVGGREV